jgi:hypothetical protein
LGEVVAAVAADAAGVFDGGSGLGTSCGGEERAEDADAADNDHEGNIARCRQKRNAASRTQWRDSASTGRVVA